MAKSDKSLIQRFRDSESSTSVLFGAIVVVVVGVLLFNYSRSNPTISDEGELTESTTMTSPTGVELPTSHAVVAGETLWAIAMKYYGNGELWTDLAVANDLGPQGLVEVGQELAIPVLAKAADEPDESDVTQPAEEVAEAAEASEAAEAAEAAPEVKNDKNDQYKVLAGDSLWNIAQARYKDGYRWVDIYNANKALIADPNLIYPGQNFVLPQ